MNIKVKHRILGVVVIIGLFIILLPFFQRGKDLTPETAAIKTPPFPDQAVQVTNTPAPTPVVVPNPEPAAVMPAPTPAPTNTQPTPQTPSTPIATPTAMPTPSPTTETNAASTSEPPAAITMLQLKEDIKESPDDIIKTNHVATEATSAPQITNPILAEPATPKKVKASIAAKKQREKTPDLKTVALKAEKHSRTPIHMHEPLDNNGLFKLHSASWILQVGSYKNKANALRVVNSLRANGYPAFIQQLSDNTRVYVGPESTPTSARELAQSIENDLHLKSVVISYKPLSL